VAAKNADEPIADAESGTRSAECDRNGWTRRIANETRAKSRQRAMQSVQYGVAMAWIALHPQHDYFLIIEKRKALLHCASLKG
jgi:hypothetical protein